MPSELKSTDRPFPVVRAFAFCCLVAALAVTADGIVNSQIGSLARPPEFDGVSYMLSGQTAYRLIDSAHLRTAIHTLNGTIAPLWVAILALHYLVLGSGPWQSFAARLWPLGLLLGLVFWIVGRRAPRSLAVAAVVFTALLPLASAGVRAGSWELLSGQVNYNLDFGMDDLRPDFMASVLTLCAVATLAEQGPRPDRRLYLASAAFAALAVLVKASTSPVVLAVWALALAMTWFGRRRESSALRETAISVAALAILLGPWAILGHGAANVVDYVYHTEVTFGGVYATNESLIQKVTYFPALLPIQLGRIEAWIVIVGALLLTVALFKRALGWSEATYGMAAVAFYVVFSLSSSKNPQLGIWISTAVWIFFLAGGARLAAERWAPALRRVSPAVLGAVALYTLVVYGLAVAAVMSWPNNERMADAQQVGVTDSIALELTRHLASDQCFTYAPGPGWPASIEFAAMATRGSSPVSTATDIDVATTTVEDYVAAARRCDAFVVYEQDMGTVAQVFYAPPIYQPYLQAVADWVRTPGNGFTLDRKWVLTNMPPIAPHTLGRYHGLTLTVDLYLRMPS